MTMTFETAFKQVKELFFKLDAGEMREHLAYQFHLTGTVQGIFYVEAGNGNLSVEPYEYNDRDAVLICAFEVLLDILMGKSDFLAAIQTGRIRVEGSMEKALKLSALMKDN